MACWVKTGKSDKFENPVIIHNDNDNEQLVYLYWNVSTKKYTTVNKKHRTGDGSLEVSGILQKNYLMKAR